MFYFIIAKYLYCSWVNSNVQDHVAHSSSLHANQFYRVGSVAFNFISDVVNYNFSLSNGTRILNNSKNYMVGPSRKLERIVLLSFIPNHLFLLIRGHQTITNYLL